MQKAIAAIVGGVVSLLANFGLELSPELLNVINGAVALVVPVLVYLIPNTAKPAA
jgi:hypothetical protein